MIQLTPDETLLGLLAARSQHGYQLLDTFRNPDQLGLVWNLSTSQLYAVLKRLEGQGLIAGRQVDSPDAPPRTEYTLTETGWVRLQEWLHERQPSSSIRRVRVEFLSRLYVMRLLDLPGGQVIEAQKNTCREAQAHLHARRDQIGPGIGRLALEFMIAQMDAVLRWIDRYAPDAQDQAT
jgi:DNA-binding PadR family transcriptional regulator